MLHLRVAAILLAVGTVLTLIVGSPTADARAGRPDKLTLWGVDRSGDAINAETKKAEFSEKLTDGGEQVGEVEVHVKRTHDKYGQYLTFTGNYKLDGGKIKVEGSMIRSYYLDTSKATLDIVRGKGRFHGITGHLRFLPKHGETKHTFSYRPPV